ncbi:hypothetical protein [Mycobacterium sp.]|uniref:hypothetical protein n=1 Tax=Mycobacterium sp. TaxID=1785 RepID=UPI003C775BE2
MSRAPKLAPGTRLVSTRCSTQVIVVRAPNSPAQVTCGAAPMKILGAAEPRTLGAVPSGSGGVELGKRYSDSESGLQLLCTQAGAGPLAVDGRQLGMTHAAPLPSSHTTQEARS